MTQEERFKCLEEGVEHWKKVAAGLKGYNNQLKAQVEHYRELDLEGDELYEKKIAELEEANKRIAELENETDLLKTKCVDLTGALREMKCKHETLADILEYETTPWWKKILMMFK